MNSTAWRRPRSTARRKSPRAGGRLRGRHADHVVERRQGVAGAHDGAVLVLVLRPQRLGDRRDVDCAEIERDDAFAEAAGLHQLGVGGLSPAASSTRMASAWLVERGLV